MTKKRGGLTAIQLLSHICVKMIVDYSSIVVSTPVADTPRHGLFPHDR
jgi:hypothetical protein